MEAVVRTCRSGICSAEVAYIISNRAEAYAIERAKKLQIPVIALSNSDSNIRSIEYPILGNDASIPSISLITEAIVRAYEEGKTLAADSATKEKTKND